jgi:cation diffusion facilitator family transporter
MGTKRYLQGVTPQRRTALVSIVAATLLIGIKLVTGLATGSLGLISEAAHSGIDLIAALLTFFAVGVAGRPADPGHPYGHGKAEHLAALAEAGILVGLSLAVGAIAAGRLVGGGTHQIEVTWWALAVIGVVIVVDASRAVISWRASRRYSSPAFATNALHFASDLAGSTAVLIGLLAARAGHPAADAAAALFVALLVLVAAARLVRQNADVLMDRSPTRAHEAALRAIEDLEDVDVRRLRMRSAAGRHFADVVIGVPPAAAVEQGHAAASAVEDAVERAVPGADVVVHVEPREDEAGLRERAHAAALAVPGVREIHNVVVLEVGPRTEVSLHLKLPGALTLDAAHEVASRVEEAIRAALPEVDDVQTHLEPLAEPESGRPVEAHEAAEVVHEVVREATGAEPRALRFLDTDRGLVAHLTLGLDPGGALIDAHALASQVEEAIRRLDPSIADVVVHTEP